MDPSTSSPDPTIYFQQAVVGICMGAVIGLLVILVTKRKSRILGDVLLGAVGIRRRRGRYSSHPMANEHSHATGGHCNCQHHRSPSSAPHRAAFLLGVLLPVLNEVYRLKVIRCSAAVLKPSNSGLEAIIDFNLITVAETIGPLAMPDHGHDLRQTAGRSSRPCAPPPCGTQCSSRIGWWRYGEVDHFLGERIERARRHDLLHRFRGSPQRRWIVRQRFPEIVDPIRPARGHDAPVDSANFRGGIRVFNQSESGHRL